MKKEEKRDVSVNAAYYAAHQEKARESKRKYCAAYRDEIKPRTSYRDKACNLSAACRLTNAQIAIAREQIRKGLPINFKGN